MLQGDHRVDIKKFIVKKFEYDNEDITIHG